MDPNDARLVAMFQKRQRLFNRAEIPLIIAIFGLIILGNTQPPVLSGPVGNAIIAIVVIAVLCISQQVSPLIIAPSVENNFGGDRTTQKSIPKGVRVAVLP